MNKGQCVTKYYRWIQKNGGYIWIQSSATITINAKNANEKNIIWVNYVLSNPEYKDVPMDIAQLPNLPEKASESSETSDSESDFKDNSEDNENSKSDGKGNQSSEHSEDPESDSKKQSRQPSHEQEMRRQEEGDSSSNPESQDSEDSLEPSDCEAESKEGRPGRLGGLRIKVEHYGDAEALQLRDSNSSSSEEEEDDEDAEEDEEEEDDDDDDDDPTGLSPKDCGGMTIAELAGPAASKHQKRKKRRKKQKWNGGGRRQRLRLCDEDPVSPPLGDPGALGEQPPLLPPPSPASASVLKIKTEMSEPINFDNDSSIWNYPPNREISRNESPYSMTKPPAGGATEPFPSPQGSTGLQVAIPDSVLTPPGTDGGGGGRKQGFNGSGANGGTPNSTSSVGSNLAPPSSSSSSDPLSPPLSASPRDKQQGGTPTTTSSSSTSSSSSSSSGSLLYGGDLEALQRLQAGNMVLPLVHRVTGTLAAAAAATSTSGSAAPRVYTTGTIRYAPADVTLAMQGANLLAPNTHAMNFVDVNSPGFAIDPKTPMEMLYHHVHRLNMSGPFGGAVTGASLTQMPAAAANVFTTAEGLFSTLPFPVYSNGIHATQTLDRKED
ncbi:hypothetical protein ACEWY4_005542 [Coilia grayii]|uniref:PAS fold-3 domain-containing protein n=1 Tax=Coilia grayii TaxID=363190 RepID=A0ABD1KIZ4_9TELE